MQWIYSLKNCLEKSWQKDSTEQSTTGNSGEILQKNKLTEMCPWGSPDIGHTRQNFKSTVLNVHKELKETMGKEDGQGVMAYQSTELSALSWEPVPG